MQFGLADSVEQWLPSFPFLQYVAIEVLSAPFAAAITREISINDHYLYFNRESKGQAIYLSRFNLPKGNLEFVIILIFDMILGIEG